MARSKMCSRGSNFGGFWLTTVNFIVFLMVFNSNISNGMCGLRVLRQAQATGANDPTNQNATVPELPITPDSTPGSGATNATTDPAESPLAVNPPVNPVENPTAVQSANETAPQLNATSATVTDPATVAPTTIPTTTTTTLAPTTVAPATTETPTTTTQKPAMEKPSAESPNGKGAASNMSYNVAFILVTIALLSF